MKTPIVQIVSKAFINFSFSIALVISVLVGNAKNAAEKQSEHGVSNIQDTVLTIKNVNTKLQNAKIDRNWKQVEIQYRTLLYYSKSTIQLQYADSMVMAAKRTMNNENIGKAYLTKGILYYASS